MTKKLRIVRLINFPRINWTYIWVMSFIKLYFWIISHFISGYIYLSLVLFSFDIYLDPVLTWTRRQWSWIQILTKLSFILDSARIIFICLEFIIVLLTGLSGWDQFLFFRFFSFMSGLCLCSSSQITFCRIFPDQIKQLKVQINKTLFAHSEKKKWLSI